MIIDSKNKPTFTINEDGRKIVRIKLTKEIYPKEAIVKASYFFTDKYYMSLDTDEKYYYIDIGAKEDNVENNVEKEFLNEVITQTARYGVMQQTKNIRELIIGRALASTIVDDSDTGFIDDETVKSEDILFNWFDKYDK